MYATKKNIKLGSKTVQNGMLLKIFLALKAKQTYSKEILATVKWIVWDFNKELQWVAIGSKNVYDFAAKHWRKFYNVVVRCFVLLINVVSRTILLCCSVVLQCSYQRLFPVISFLFLVVLKLEATLNKWLCYKKMFIYLLINPIYITLPEFVLFFN